MIRPPIRRPEQPSPLGTPAWIILGSGTDSGLVVAASRDLTDIALGTYQAPVTADDLPHPPPGLVTDRAHYQTRWHLRTDLDDLQIVPCVGYAAGVATVLRGWSQ